MAWLPPAYAGFGPQPQMAPGLLGALGMQANPLTGWLGDHRNALLGLSSGLLSSPTFAGGLSQGFANAAQGGQVDQQAADKRASDAETKRQQNATLAWLKSKGYNDLVAATNAGLPIANAWQAGLARAKGPAPTAPQYFKMADGSIVEANNGSAQSIYQTPTAPASNVPQVSLGADGTPDPAAQAAFLQTLPDQNYANTVKAVANYEIDPRAASKRGDSQLKLIEDAKAYDPTYDSTQFAAKAATRRDFMTGQSAGNLKSANTLIGHLNDLQKASDALGNGSFTPWNAVVNATKKMTGNADPTTYNVAAQASADELAKVFKGSGASDVASIAGWQGSLDPNNSPQQQKAAINEAVTLLESRIAALRDQYQNAMGKPANFTFLNAASAKALNDLGFNPKEVDPNYGSAPLAPGLSDAPAPDGGGGIDDLLTKYGAQ